MGALHCEDYCNCVESYCCVRFLDYISDIGMEDTAEEGMQVGNVLEGEGANYTQVC